MQNDVIFTNFDAISMQICMDIHVLNFTTVLEFLSAIQSRLNPSGS